MRGSVPDRLSLSRFLSQIRFIWCNRVTFDVSVAEMPRHFLPHCSLFLRRQNFLNTLVINEVLAF
jgi:hypothetical protein